MKNIVKSHNHLNFTISKGVLYEVYQTIRGVRYRKILNTPFLNDTKKCSDALIDYLNNKL